MHRTSLISFVLAGATAFSAACGSSGDINGNGGGDDDPNHKPDAGERPDARTNGPTDPNMPTDPNAAGCRKMDILFVIDDSGSMKEEQDNLAIAFKNFAAVLDNFVITTGEHLDYRVAVTTTDRSIYLVYDGDDVLEADTRGLNDGKFIEYKGKRWIGGADAGHADALRTIASVGVKGSSLEMPL